MGLITNIFGTDGDDGDDGIDGQDGAQNVARLFSRYDCDFFSALVGTIFTVNAASSGQVVNAVDSDSHQHPGVVKCRTITNAASRAAFYSEASIKLGGGAVRCGWLIKTPATLSNGTDNYTMYAGMFAVQPTNTNACVGFIYNHATNSGQWQGLVKKTSGGNTSDTVNSSMAVAADTWYFLEVEVNAAGTAVEFFVTVAGTRTSIGTISSIHIPTASTDGVGLGTGQYRSAGIASRDMSIDAVELEIDLTTARWT